MTRGGVPARTPGGSGRTGGGSGWTWRTRLLLVVNTVGLLAVAAGITVTVTTHGRWTAAATVEAICAVVYTRWILRLVNRVNNPGQRR